MDSNNHCVLVLGAYRQTLSVLRSLSHRHRLILGCVEPDSFVIKSKHVDETWIHQTLSDATADQFFAELAELLRQRPSIQVIFPVGDSEILFLSRYADRLPHGVHCVMPAAEVAEVCQRKAKMFSHVREQGVPAATYRSVADGRESLLSAVDEVGLPCIIKPEDETSRVFGKKAFIAVTRQALIEALARHESESEAVPQAVIVQKYCLGGRRNIYFFAQQGEKIVHDGVAGSDDDLDQMFPTTNQVGCRRAPLGQFAPVDLHLVDLCATPAQGLGQQFTTTVAAQDIDRLASNFLQFGQGQQALAVHALRHQRRRQPIAGQCTGGSAADRSDSDVQWQLLG